MIQDASDDESPNNHASDDSGTDTSYETLYLINAGGDAVINRNDIFAEAGGFTAIEKVFTVETDNELEIIFTRIKQNPAEKGIKIVVLNAADSSQTDNTSNTQSSNQSNNTSSNQKDTTADNDPFTPLEPDKEGPHSCSVSGATLAMAKLAYAATCSLPRKDCDPKNGG